MSNRHAMVRNKQGDMITFHLVSDYQRKKLYNAERRWNASMWNEIESKKMKGSSNGCTMSPNADPTSIFYIFPSPEAVKEYLDSLCGQKWMKEEFGTKVANSLLNTTVHRRRGIKTSHATFFSIHLAPNWGFRKDTVLHEFTHVIVNALDEVDGGHGRLFAKTHLTLIKHAVSADASQLLQYMYDNLGVKYSGDDQIFINEKIKKLDKAIVNGLVILSYNPHKDTFCINRFPIQKIGTSYVPSMELNRYGLGRVTEWNYESYDIDGQKTKLHWEMRWGKYGYFSLTNEDGSIQWYKFRMENNDTSFDPGGLTDRYMFTPAFAKNYTEDELVVLARTMLSK